MTTMRSFYNSFDLFSTQTQKVICDDLARRPSTLVEYFLHAITENTPFG